MRFGGSISPVGSSMVGMDLVSRSDWARCVDLDVTSDGGKLEEIGGFLTVTTVVQDLFLLLVGPS